MCGHLFKLDFTKSRNVVESSSRSSGEKISSSFCLFCCYYLLLEKDVVLQEQMKSKSFYRQTKGKAYGNRQKPTCDLESARKSTL